MSKKLRAPASLPWLLVLAAFAWRSAEWQEATAPPTTLDVRSLRVVDEAGRPRIVLALDAEGRPKIELLGAEDDDVPLRLSAQRGAGTLELTNADGKPIVQMGASKNGHGGLRVVNSEGTRVFYLGEDLRGNGVADESAHPGQRVVD